MVHYNKINLYIDNEHAAVKNPVYLNLIAFGYIKNMIRSDMAKNMEIKY